MPLLAETVRHLAAALTVAALVIAALALGSAILMPLAAAAILSFMLSPVVRWLDARGLPHGLAVGGVIGLLLMTLMSAALLLSVELLSITAQVGDYRENVVAKVRQISVRDSGPIKRAADAVDRLGAAVERELEQPQEAPATPVIVREVDSAAAAALARLTATIQPLAGLGLMLLFTLFLLLRHQDMRDRIVRVLGTNNLSETTSAMSEAGWRLSRLYLAQAMTSTAYGLVVGGALWMVGLPGALLWGVLAGLMRFVPFIGSFIAAAPPILVAAGVDPGWGLALFTALFFILGEVLMGNLIEPLVLGRRAGLSPFAMIAAASFWTLVWGPLGLLVAAPLTTALVVFGRHLPGLTFVSVLLGDEPALEPEQVLYHRLLAADALGAAEQLETAIAGGTGQLGDALVMPALRLAASDAAAGRLTSEQMAVIRDTLHEAMTLVPELAPPSENAPCEAVLIVPARGNVDTTAATFLATAIASRARRRTVLSDRATGLTALAGARAADTDGLGAIVIATVGTVSARQLGFIASRALRDFPAARILVLATDTQDIDRAQREATGRLRYIPNVAELIANLKLAAPRADASEATATDPVPSLGTTAG